jgi:thymidine kinase
MAKLYFRYSAMNSGKTTALIQAAFNYEERGMHVVVLKPRIDTKGESTIVSRLGAKRKVDLLVSPKDNVRSALEAQLTKSHFDCLLVDEAQFLATKQIDDLFWFAVNRDIPVLTYGLRTDFKTNGFPGSTRLLELAHELQELKTICRCGRKALFNGRKVNGKFVASGDQVAIDGEAKVDYESLCATCYQDLVLA